MTSKPITEGKDPAVAAAEQAWERLRTSFLGGEKALIDIIKGRLWEPLGYESFAKAYVEQMADVRIRPELAPHVVYALIDEEIPLDEIADLVKGVGPETVAVLDRKKKNGVSPNLANGATSVEKEKPTLTLYIGAKRLEKWNRIAGEFNIDLRKKAIEWIETRIDDLDNVPRGE